MLKNKDPTIRNLTIDLVFRGLFGQIRRRRDRSAAGKRLGTLQHIENTTDKKEFDPNLRALRTSKQKTNSKVAELRGPLQIDPICEASSRPNYGREAYSVFCGDQDAAVG